MTAVARALAERPERAACAALARPHDWDVLAARMVGEIESRIH